MIKPRICKLCGNPIHLVEERENVVWFRSGFAHKSCYINYYATKKCPWSEEKIRAFLPSVYIPAQEKIDSIIADEQLKQEIENKNKELKEEKKRMALQKALQKQQKQQQKIEVAKEKGKQKQLAKSLANVNEEQRKAFFDFVRDTYAPSVIPNRFYAKLQRYVFGTEPTYKGNIPPEYFHDMWQRMLPKLNAIDASNRACGKIVEQRWNYDLAIVLSRYPSYLAWREKQALQAQAIMDFHPPGKPPVPVHCDAQNSAILPHHNAQNSKHSSDEIDISSMLDEI